MYRIVLPLCLIGLAVAFPQLETSTWHGPFADHVIGQPVRDTPAVELAKQHHFNQYSEVLKVLPKLSEEELQGTNQPDHHVDNVNSHVHNVHHHQQQYQVNVPYVPPTQGYIPPTPPSYHHHVHQPVDQHYFDVASPAPVITKFAEEIPRSEFGEVPEVAAAREAHLLAHKIAHQMHSSLARKF